MKTAKEKRGAYVTSFSVDSINSSDTGFSKVFHTRTRFLLLCLVLLCLASIWSNILCFNFALLCIEESDHSDTVGINLGANARSERSSDPIFEHLKGSEVQNLTRNSTHQGFSSQFLPIKF